jgi:membrane fusion protein (multidrug efflux system)
MLGARVTGPAELLTTIDVLDPVRITFRPSTQQVLAWRRDSAATRALRPGGTARVSIVLPDSVVYPESGKLDFVAPVVDSATGTEEYRAEVPNREHLLVPGQFVRVRLEGLVRNNAILIPQRAVVPSLGRQSVYVLGPGDTVRSRDVRATAWVGLRWLIDSGLVAGDRVIVDGVQKVRPGGIAKPVPVANDSTAPHGAPGAPSAPAKP